MRTVKHTSRFKRDYKREKLGRRSKRLDAELMPAVRVLAEDEPLPRRCFDHPLGGEWSDHRDCHIRPDLILIYRKPDDASLELVRLGSHASVGYERPASSERARRAEI
jgi:mRNA interferase YafQ